MKMTPICWSSIFVINFASAYLAALNIYYTLVFLTLGFDFDKHHHGIQIEIWCHNDRTGTVWGSQSACYHYKPFLTILVYGKFKNNSWNMYLSNLYSCTWSKYVLSNFWCKYLHNIYIQTFKHTNDIIGSM